MWYSYGMTTLERHYWIVPVSLSLIEQQEFDLRPFLEKEGREACAGVYGGSEDQWHTYAVEGPFEYGDARDETARSFIVRVEPVV